METLECPSVSSESPHPDDFIKNLFGAQSQSHMTSSWLPVVLEAAKSVVRTGLSEDLKKVLLAKYNPGVGASLNALASGFSELSNLELLQTSSEGRAAISKIAEGIRLLADHYFGLSKTRWAFIVPSLNFLGKAASDSAAVDELLFGNNFTDEVNAAQMIEKVANRMAKKKQQSTQRMQPSTGQQQKQQKNQPFHIAQSAAKNVKTPPRRTLSSYRPRGGSPQMRRRTRSQSRSRAHR
ncbi:hypothetical protein ALC57_05588 [Trachymyrmex cornetzi]|uniref:Uncharacterized protein n=1 Tax=Trachymyrmex cornetzi TaxID=471704 RepID=A0A151JAI0_9HYME|nr:hypothetical protein ALC57_05588 [Trachymyrmex cornetzi]